MTLLEFLKGNNPILVRDYIFYFFKNIANIKLDNPIYEKLVFDLTDNVYTSIVKDTVDRIDNSRHLSQRNSRNCFFCFLEKEKWNEFVESKCDNVTDKRKKESEIEKAVAEGIHKIFKRNHIAWYVHSFVYIVLVFASPEELVSKDNFAIYYWNTNYTFKKFPNKSAIFGNTRYVKFVDNPNHELELIESKDKELIDCVKAFKYGEKDFELFGLTKEHLDDVSFEIENGVEYSIIEGPARSGKTILAMLLMNKYKECKLLLLNYVFYKDLKMAFKTLGLEFPKDRIFHHNLADSNGNWLSDYKTLKFVSDFSFLIVDEAQRMGRLNGFTNRYGIEYPPFDPFDEIKKIENHKHTIFLGDNLQRINGKHDEGFEIVKKYYLDKVFREHKFYQTIGIPKSMIGNILFLLGFEDKKPNNPGEYKLEVMETVEDFIQAFEIDLNNRKHYVSLALDYGDDFGFNGIKPLPREYSEKFNYLFDDEIAYKYYLTPYEIISRESESVYLYIPDFVKELNYKDSQTRQSDLIYRQLYTLMTRATASLVIYSANDNVRDVLLQRVKDINNTSEVEVENKNYKYDVFIAYHGTYSEHGSYEYAKKLCDLLTESGLSVFLNGYSCDESDRDLGFNETTRIIQKSRQLVAVINDYVPVDDEGMMLRVNNDSSLNQLYQELKTFNDLLNIGQREHKSGFRFYYCGEETDYQKVYTFLNKLYHELTYGFDCALLSKEDVLRWALDYKQY